MLARIMCPGFFGAQRQCRVPATAEGPRRIHQMLRCAHNGAAHRARLRERKGAGRGCRLTASALSAVSELVGDRMLRLEYPMRLYIDGHCRKREDDQMTYL